jgi:hypothetical protein
VKIISCTKEEIVDKGRKHTSDIIQHTQPEQRIRKAQDRTRYNRRPITRVSITGEGEPEERDGEEPDCHERDKEPRFGSVVAMVSAITGVEPGLHRDEAEHD